MVNASGHFRPALVGLGIVLGVITGCTGSSAGTAHLSSSAQATLPTDFGKADTRFPCRPKWTLWIPCPNFSRHDFSSDPANAKAARFLRKFNDDGKWSDPTLPIVREVEDGQPPAYHMLRVIRDPREIQFRGITSGNVVMARMDVHRSSGTDRRYGIAPDPDDAEWQLYFLVVELSPPEANTANDGHRFGTWRIYRVVKGTAGGSDSLERVGKSGRYQWCAMPHDGSAYENGSTYASCSTARALQMIAGRGEIARVLKKEKVSLMTAIQQKVGVAAAMTAEAPAVEGALRSLLGMQDSSPDAFARVVSPPEIALIATALRDAHSAPAWMMCGVGCCTADDPG